MEDWKSLYIEIFEITLQAGYESLSELAVEPATFTCAELINDGGAETKRLGQLFEKHALGGFDCTTANECWVFFHNYFNKGTYSQPEAISLLGETMREHEKCKRVFEDYKRLGFCNDRGEGAPDVLFINSRAHYMVLTVYYLENYFAEENISQTERNKERARLKGHIIDLHPAARYHFSPSL